MITAIGYARLSTQDDAHGLSVQREAIRRFCERKGISLLRIEEDEASGKSTRKRPGLKRAIESCEATEATAIVCTRVDRIARSSLDHHRIIEAVQGSGGTILFTEQESFSLDNPEGRMLASILAAWAAYEAELISQRTKAALAHVKVNGSKTGNPVGNPHFKRANGEVMKRIRTLRADGLSYARIAQRLEEEGISGLQGGKWTGTTIRRIALRG